MAVGTAAFGAHGASTEQAAHWLETAGHYQLTHAIATLILAHLAGQHRSAMLLLVGSLVFALTLDAMALGAPRWLGAVTPIGGLGLIAGWAVVAVSAWRG